MRNTLKALKKKTTGFSVRKEKIGKDIVYPESDGKPMADNTKQFEWIVKIKEGLESLFKDQDDVFVAGDFFWYPVEGNNKIRVAPDAMIVFGRPKGHRGSYLQWKEDNIPPQVVFEILSPGNTPAEMKRKLGFYEKYGVEEYYLYDPDKVKIEGWIRSEEKLIPVKDMKGWKSPLLNIRFEPNDELKIFDPDGHKFLTFVETVEEAEREKQRAEKEKHRAEKEKHRADQAEKIAEQERLRAEMLEAKLKMLEQRLSGTL